LTRRLDGTEYFSNTFCPAEFHFHMIRCKIMPISADLG